MFKRKVIPFFVWLFYRTWISTWRMRVIEPPQLKEQLKKEPGKIIFSMWHGNELAAIAFSKYYKLATMTSTSEDGQIMDFVLRRLGFQTSRGSSTRGAVSALKGLVRLARKGHITVFPVDGPKGPLYEPKPGVFELSRLTQGYIYPCGIACSSAIRFEKSWNKTFLPRPFSKVVMYWGEPMEPIQKSMDPRNPQLSSKLKAALDAAGRDAAKRLR